MAGIDINRGTSGIVLPPEVSDEIWAKTLEQSAVMRLARKTTLPGAGKEFDIITGEPEANWVTETGIKPIGTHTVSSKVMRGYTLAVIEPFSNQFRRDKRALYREMVNRLPLAIAKKFDKTVFGLAQAPGSDFDTLANATAVDIETDSWEGLVTAEDLIATAEGELNGYVLSPKGRTMLKKQKGNDGHPLFVSDIINGNRIDAIDGAQVIGSRGVYAPAADGDPAQLGFAGDWTSAVYGIVEGITIRISDQASLTTDDGILNLFERNMFAVRCEFEAGFRTKFDDHFVKLVAASGDSE